MPDDENSTTNTSQDTPMQSPAEQPSPVTFPDQVQSQPQTETPAPVAAGPAKSVNTPGVLVLQWLTYAFWGWTLVAMYWLTSLVVQYFIREPNDYNSSYEYMGEMVAYSLAAVIVLLIISMVCDFFYSKFEPRAKSGAAMVIMIIHAVIFALCAIGSVIVAVFAVVNMAISGESEGATTALVTASIMSLLYAATLVRTLHPAKVLHSTKAHWAIMIAAVVVIAGLGIFGPAVAAQRVKDDLALEAGLGDIADAIGDYTSDNGKLPSNLNDSELRKSYTISSNEDAVRILDENLVDYTPGKKVSTSTDILGGLNNNESGVSVRTYDLDATDDSVVYQYRLCVNYDNEKKGYTSDYDYGYSRSSKGEYPVNPNTSSHAAGKVCYDLQTGYAD